MGEINRGYINHIERLGGDSFAPKDAFIRQLWQRFVWGNEIRYILLPFMYIFSLCLVICLSLYRYFKKGIPSSLHKKSMDYIKEFVTQYPMHLYPVVAKSLELSFLREHLEGHAKGKIVEVAIGEGTLSKRIFSEDKKVVGLDLNPYSLVKTRGMSHVAKRVVCDCLNPPIALGTFDFLLANNFLHHVTEKRMTLSNWAQIADDAIFNENTPVWASAWIVPYVLSKLGMSNWSRKSAKNLEVLGMQYLEDEKSLDEIVNEFYIIKKRESFMDAKTFFLSSLFSAFMRCYGPPTPERLKKLFLGKLKFIAIPLTKRLAELLIHYDSHRSRKADAFISYVCKSKIFSAYPSDEFFICPECRAGVKDNVCLACGKRYMISDDMLFLLPEYLSSVKDAYHSENVEKISAEHL